MSPLKGGTRRYAIDYLSVNDFTFSVHVRLAFNDFRSMNARRILFMKIMKGKMTGVDGTDRQGT